MSGIDEPTPSHLAAGQAAGARTNPPTATTHAPEARAVEVVAMLGDSVIGVRHLADPRAGKHTPPTLALLAGGALMLVMSLYAFGIGVDNAAYNKAARHEWIHQLERPPHAFRPRRLDPRYDWMAFGGGIGALLALSIGLARWRGERQPSCYRVGTAPDVELPLEGAPAASFPLVAAHDAAHVFHFAPGMDGEMRVGQEHIPLADLPARGLAHPSPTVPDALQAAIPAGARVRLAMGTSTFLIASVPRPRRHAVPLFAPLERRSMTFLGSSAALHLGLAAMLLSLPPAPQALALSLRGGNERVTRVRSVAQEPPRPEESPENASNTPGGTGTAMDLEAGAMGTAEAQRERGRRATKRQDTDRSPTTRERAIAGVGGRGILGALRRTHDGAFASITASAEFSSGLDDASVYGRLHDMGTAATHGAFGFAPTGNGPGGGGSGWSTIGTGRYGTIGHGAGPAPGYGGGIGIGRGPGHRPIGPTVDIEDPITHGELDKSLIRRRIRQRLARIRHCYERQLPMSPDIAGTVEATFQIDPQGAVLGATAHGVHDQVARCVADIIRHVQFPKPRGGGLVQVRYPFTFRSTAR